MKGGLYRMKDGERVLIERTAPRPAKKPATPTSDAKEPADQADDQHDQAADLAEDESAAAPVNINTASIDEIAAAAVGVGKKMARNIVKYRSARGPFGSLDELSDVGGIGDEVIENNRDRLTV